MGEQDKFLRLESLLKKTPDNSTFIAICELFIDWIEGQEKDEALDYADKNLSLWADTLLHVSSSWSSLYCNEIAFTWGRLIRSIEIYRRCEEGTKELIRVAKSPSLKNLQRYFLVL
jgi:hypothetical protein